MVLVYTYQRRSIVGLFGLSLLLKISNKKKYKIIKQGRDGLFLVLKLNDKFVRNILVRLWCFSL